MDDALAFLPGLDKSLGYIRGYVASLVLFDLLQSDLLPALGDPRPVRQVADEKGVDPELLRTLCEYLVHEEILEKRRGAGAEPEFSLSEYGRQMGRYKGWFNMLIGGYGPVFSNIGRMLREGTGAASRVGRWVGVGSCQISHYDSIPLTRELVRLTRPGARSFVDLGCGNGLYLCTFCREMPGIQAIGVEPDRGSFEAGVELVRREGMEDRIRLVHAAALDYRIEEAPDFIMLNFVLHEIQGQVGEARMLDFLRDIGRRFPRSLLLVVEVDYDPDNRAAMRTPVGLGYYNPYYLLHPFTRQRLGPEEQWDELFAAAGFKTVAKQTVDAAVDPTGLEIGWVLEYMPASPAH